MATQQFYQQALDELEHSGRDDGLWAKSIVQAQGNEDKARAIYIKKRARQLSDSLPKRRFVDRISYRAGRLLGIAMGRK
ncbi:hypothetical protein OT109_12760 [Phycisphaeraceae bacterium D3-23]